MRKDRSRQETKAGHRAPLRPVADEGVDYIDLSPLKGQGFTQRQIDILALLQRGHSFASVADALGCSRETVKTHLKRLQKRLDASGSLEAVSRAAAMCVHR